MKNKCTHPEFRSVVTVNKMENHRFMALIKVKCARCNQLFQFYGTAPGMDLNGVRTSADGVELRVAIGTPETLAAYYKSTCGVSIHPDGPEEMEAKDKQTSICRDVVEVYIKPPKVESEHVTDK